MSLDAKLWLAFAVLLALVFLLGFAIGRWTCDCDETAIDGRQTRGERRRRNRIDRMLARQRAEAGRR